MSVLERCPSYRGSNKGSKERQGPTLGVRFTQLSVKSESAVQNTFLSPGWDGEGSMGRQIETGWNSKKKDSWGHVIGHFRVPQGLCTKTRLKAQSLIWKSLFIPLQTKLIFTGNVCALGLILKVKVLELGSGLLGV